MRTPRRLHGGPIRLDRLRRWSVYGLTGLLFLSGLGWCWLHVDDALPNPAEPWLMRLHGAAAMLAIYLAGTMLFEHMVNAWHRHRNRISGAMVAAAWLALGISGYGLYYFSGESLRRWTEWTHWGFGLAAPVVLALHIVLGRQRRHQSHK